MSFVGKGVYKARDILIIVMTKEERKALLLDVTARLQYGIVVKAGRKYGRIIAVRTCGQVIVEFSKEGNGPDSPCSIVPYDIEEVTVFLRRLCTATEEELKEYNSIVEELQASLFTSNCYKLTDWFNAHFFDNRGMIDNGLVKEAKDKMYNI